VPLSKVSLSIYPTDTTEGEPALTLAVVLDLSQVKYSVPSIHSVAGATNKSLLVL
jgi:hypothetical protein